MEKAASQHSSYQQQGPAFQINLCYVENSFRFYTFKNCQQSLVLTQLQAVVLEHAEVQPQDQLLFRIDGSRLVKLESGEEQIYQGSLSTSGPSSSSSSAQVDIVLLNKQIQSETDLKDLLIFAANEEEDFYNSRSKIDLQNLLKPDGALNIKDAQQNAGAKASREQRYEQISINSGVMSDDITENFNFKKINSLSTQPQCSQLLSQEGIDIVTLQTFEQLFFSNFQKIKSAFRKFKGISKDCQAELKHFETIQRFVDALNRHFSPSPSHGSSMRGVVSQTPSENLKAQLLSLKEMSSEVLKLYADGIGNLKKIELHPKMQVDGKKYLIDIYYKEDQMNSFRDSLIRQLDRLKVKVDHHLRSSAAPRGDAQTSRTVASDGEEGQSERAQGKSGDHGRIVYDEKKAQYLANKLQDEIVDAHEPLILSLVHAMYEELSGLHKMLRNLVEALEDPSGASSGKQDVKAMSEYLVNLQHQFKQKLTGQNAYVDQISGYIKDIDQKVIVKMQDFKYQMSKEAITLKKKEGSATRQAQGQGVSGAQSQGNASQQSAGSGDDVIAKQLLDDIQKLRKDFSYLRKPSILPRAYEQSLMEMKRRTIFRKGLDNYVNKLKKIIETEKDKRNSFINNQVQYLPSHFWPQLKEPTPTLSLQGQPYELKFPDFTGSSEVKCDTKIFESMGASMPGGSLSQSADQCHTLDEKQVENLQEDLENHKSLVQAKELIVSQLKSRLEVKDQDINNLRAQIEQLNRSFKDLSQSQKVQIRFNEEKIAKKQKELDTIIKDKKCKNCPICLEGMNFEYKDQIDLITELNKNLLSKSQQNDGLLEQLNKANSLMSEVCSHNFTMLRQKTQDFLKSHDQLKSRYERKLMQVEDQLALEAAKYNEIIKTRVKQLQDKNEEQRSRISALQRESDAQRLDLRTQIKQNQDLQTSIKNLHLDLKIAQKDIKIKEDKVQDLKREVSDLQKVKIDKIESIKQLQSMVKNQEKEEARVKEIQDQLKKELKDSTDECTWLKKEIDGVSEILIQRNQEIKELNSKITSLQAAEQQALAQSKEKSEQLAALTQKAATANEQCQKAQQKLQSVESEYNLKTYEQKKQSEQLRQERDQLTLEMKQLNSRVDQLQRAEIQLQTECQALKAENENAQTSLQQLEGIRQKGNTDRDNMESHIQKLEQENQKNKALIQSLELAAQQQEEDKQRIKDDEKQQSQISQDNHDKMKDMLEESKRTKAAMAELRQDMEQDNLIFDKIVQRLVEFLKHVCGPTIEQKYFEIRDLTSSIRAKHYMALPLLNFALIQFFNTEMATSQHQIDIVQLSRGGINSSLEAVLDNEAADAEARAKLRSSREIESTLKKIPKFFSEKSEQVVRLLFLPYSQGIYIAFLLQNQDYIQTQLGQALYSQSTEENCVDINKFFGNLKDDCANVENGFSVLDEEGKSNDDGQQSQQANQLQEADAVSSLSQPSLSRSASKTGQPAVQKLNIINKLFLDMEQLSKNMQVLLNNYEMHVIAQVSQISQHVATKGDYGCVKLGLQEGQRYSRCKVRRVDHIVNFTSRILGKQPGQGEENDYSFTDYIFK